MKFLILLLFIFGYSHVLQAQESVSLKDIFANYKYSGDYLSQTDFVKGDKYYASLDDKTSIQLYNIATGKIEKTLCQASQLSDEDFSGKFDGYTISADGNKILISTDTKRIYRRSRKARYYLYDTQKKSFTLLSSHHVRLATFSPSGDKVAYIHDNDIFIFDFKSNTHKRITTDGKFNHIINGCSDWVYEEEFSISRAFKWAPDGKKLAYIKFDESQVPYYDLKYFQGGLYPATSVYKYPKVGEKNSKVNVYVYDLAGDSTKKIDTHNDEDDIYIPRISWVNGRELCMYLMNRRQNDLKLILHDTRKNKNRTLLHETNPYYIDVEVDITFIADGKKYLWMSERDGHNAVYLGDTRTGNMELLTPKGTEIITVYGYDEKRDILYYRAYDGSPLYSAVYGISTATKKVKKISMRRGKNTAQFSKDFSYYILEYSNSDTPPVYTLRDKNTKVIRTLVDNAELIAFMENYPLQKKEFFTLTTEDDVSLNAYMIKPRRFSEDKKYPVLMFQYSGPGSQRVTDSWSGSDYWWMQHLAEKGYITVCVDTRGTGGRGQAFKKSTYLNLGDLETRDMIASAKYLQKQSYVDASRIGIFGWSYGGYVSSMCILKGNDVFKTAVAVAPVTNWKWYDTIYTERYMRTYEDNASGYDKNSPVNFTDRLKGNYLIIHGMYDDNVHFQHAAEMITALVNNGKEFDSFVYPNMAHGLYGVDGQYHVYNLITNYILEKL